MIHDPYVIVCAVGARSSQSWNRFQKKKSNIGVVELRWAVYLTVRQNILWSISVEVRCQSVLCVKPRGDAPPRRCYPRAMYSYGCGHVACPRADDVVVTVSTVHVSYVSHTLGIIV